MVVVTDDRVSRQREIELRAREAEGYVERYREQKGIWWDELEKELLIEPLRPRWGIRVLDAGAGVGRLTGVLLDRGCNVDAVDLSFESLRILLKEHAGGERRVGAVVCDLATGLPIGPAVYDGVVCGQTVHHIPERRGRVNAWREIARVCRDGAVLSTTVYHHKPRRPVDGVYPGGPAYHRYSVADLREELAEAGWRTIGTRLCYRFEWKRLPPALASVLDMLLARLRLLDGLSTYLHAVAVKAERKGQSF